MTDQTVEPERVECPACHALIGYSDAGGGLRTPDGCIVTHLQMIHSCGATFYWNAIMERWSRAMQMRYS